VATIDDVYDYLTGANVAGKIETIRFHTEGPDLAGKINAIHASVSPDVGLLANGVLDRLIGLFNQLANKLNTEEYRGTTGEWWHTSEWDSVHGKIERLKELIGTELDRPTTEPETVLGLLMGLYIAAPDPE